MVAVSTPEAAEPRTRNPDLGTLVIQTAHLGDVILTLPLLTRLAERYGPVDVVTTPTAAALVETHPAVRRVIPFDKHGTDRGIRGLLPCRTTAPRTWLRPCRAAPRIAPFGGAGLAGWCATSAIGFAGGAGVARLYPANRAAHRRPHERTPRRAGGGNGALPARPWLALTEADRAVASAWLGAQRHRRPVRRAGAGVALGHQAMAVLRGLRRADFPVRWSWSVAGTMPPWGPRS